MGHNDINNEQKIIAVCGVKNSGKTTLLTKLVKKLSEQGLKIAVIKHDGHDFTCDIEETDSDRLKKAGAYGVAVFSKNRSFIHKEGRQEKVEDLIWQFPEADLIFLEGMKDSRYSKIEIVRKEISRHPVSNPEGRFLIVTDWETGKFHEQTVDLNDVDTIIEYILRKNKKETEELKGLVPKEILNSLLFENMNLEKAESVVQKLKGRKKSYQKNQLIISEEMYLDEIGILLSGELCKVQYFVDGTEQMVQKLRASYMVGAEIAVSKKKTSPYSVYATQDATIFWFSAKRIENAGVLSDEERIDLYQRIVHFLANEDIRKYRKIEILLCKGAREKIEKYLKIQKIKYKSREFRIEFNREQLASYLGMNRTVLSHELKKMEQEGLLKVRKNYFVLSDKW